MGRKAYTDKPAALATAFTICRRGGIDAVTIRSVAKELGCSTQPLVNLFHNMDSFRQELLIYVNDYFSRYIMEPTSLPSPFLGIGYRYVQFAAEESELFKMMFASSSLHVQSLVELMTNPGNIQVMHAIPSFEAYSDAQIKDLFTKIAIFTHGIAALVSNQSIAFNPPEITRLLQETFSAFIAQTPTTKE
jgi:AcrR family transcriptional regulator